MSLAQPEWKKPYSQACGRFVGKIEKLGKTYSDFKLDWPSKDGDDLYFYHKFEGDKKSTLIATYSKIDGFGVQDDALAKLFPGQSSSDFLRRL